MVGARWLKRLLVYLGGWLERLGRWVVQRASDDSLPAAPAEDGPPEHWLARVRAAKGWAPRRFTAPTAPTVPTAPTARTPPRAVFTPRDHAVPPTAPSGSTAPLASSIGRNGNHPAISDESPVVRVYPRIVGDEEETRGVPPAPPSPQAPRRTAPLRPIRPANPTPTQSPAWAPRPPEPRPASPTREPSPRLPPDVATLMSSATSVDVVTVGTPRTSSRWPDSPTLPYAPRTRSPASTPSQPPVPDLRREDETNDERDHDTEDPWPELPEWLTPTSHEDLMFLLREEERRFRLKAEQTGSSWSAPPF